MPSGAGRSTPASNTSTPCSWEPPSLQWSGLHPASRRGQRCGSRSRQPWARSPWRTRLATTSVSTGQGRGEASSSSWSKAFCSPWSHNASAQQAAKLDPQATAAFDAGNHARDIGDEYVRVTVLMAVVLFLTALSQRFSFRNVRLGIIGLALLMLALSIIQLVAISV